MMTQLAIRKSGGANIVSLPKAVLKALGLHTGSTLELSVEDNRIVLTPANRALDLEALVLGSPKDKLAMTSEDREWLDSRAVGHEA